jgi:spermidine synthase/Flp pilus assembly protein TadD
MPLLLLLSGFCGISYEILYTKLLGNLLGNQFTINATVLLTFLLGIGLGTLQAHRLRGYLWAIEAGIGLYAVLMVLGYDVLDQVLYSMLPGTNLYLAALVSFAVLLVPAFLIGCSIPLFAGYLALLRESRVFSVTYAIYNLGAGLTALGMEFVLLRQVGLKSATLILASLNVVVAAGIWLASRSLSVPALSGWTRFPRRVLAALAVASVASAVFQLLMIKLTEFVLGPFNETFSLVLATVLLGLALGSIVAGRLHCSFHHALLFGAGGTLGVLLLFPFIVETYAQLHPAAVESYYLLVALKLGLVVVLMGIPAAGFGATIPALLHTHKHVARESGQLLFVSCLANALGFLLMAFVLHRLLDYGPILVLIVALAATAVWIERGWTHIGSRTAAVLVALCLPAFLLGWNEGLLYLGHTAFHSVEDLETARRSTVLDQRFKGAQDVFAITRKNGEPYFFINGYISIPLSSPSEKYVGALSSMMSPRTDEALVLGVGSGATAGTVGLVFEHSDAIEINRAVLDNLHRMSEYNFDIQHRPRVNIVHDDGIHFVKTSSMQYSLILNTVTTPLYFSSSKLYTSDFLAWVKNRLTPDGVYVTWIDSRIGDRGIDIILETLGRSFRHGWMLYVKTGYFLLACSNESLGFHQLDAVARNAELQTYFTEEYKMPLGMLPYSLVSTDVLALRSADSPPLNTLDFPALEFEMARVPDGGFREFGERILARFDTGARREAISSAMDWSSGECAFHAALRLPEDSLLRGAFIDHLLPLDTDWEAVDRAALASAEELGSSSVFYKYGKVLYDSNRFEAAIAAFSRALELQPSMENIHYQLGKAYHDHGEFDSAAMHFRMEWERDRNRNVPLKLGMSLSQLGRFSEALAWLETAQVLTEYGKRKKIAFWRGIACEGLNRPLEAQKHYLEALREDPEYKAARKAMNRLVLGGNG